MRFAPVPVTLVVCSSRKGRFSHKREGICRIDIFLEAGESPFLQLPQLSLLLLGWNLDHPWLVDDPRSPDV